MEFVSWDDMTFPTEWKVIKFPWFQTTNQILYMFMDIINYHILPLTYITIYYHSWIIPLLFRSSNELTM